MVQPSFFEGVHHIHLIQSLFIASVNIFVENSYQQLWKVIIQHSNSISGFQCFTLLYLLLYHVCTNILRETLNIISKYISAEMLLFIRESVVQAVAALNYILDCTVIVFLIIYSLWTKRISKRNPRHWCMAERLCCFI
jgi:hypothetical protein